MAGIYDFIREEYEKAKKAFGLIGGIKVENDPKARELSDFERKLYEKSLIYKSMKDAVTAPMRAYRGEFDVNSPYAVQEAMNTAGMAQLGGMPGGAKGPGSVGMSSKPKGWVSGWKTRVEQPYLEGPPAPKRPRDTWGGYDTPEEYQAAQAARQIADAEWAARTSAAWQRILNEPLPSLNGVPSQAGRARLGNAMQDVQSYANNRPRNALGQEIPPTQYELAHIEAQRVAALPIEQGGLGLPPSNTAMDRARAMGFDTDAYHATDSDNILSFDPAMFGSNTRDYVDDPWAHRLADAGVWSASEDVTLPAREAMGKKGGMFGDVVYPLKIDHPKYKSKSLDALERRLHKQKLKGTTQVKDEEFGVTSYITPDPKNIRSRFAAFNPAKRDSADLLAGLAAPLTTSALLAALLAKPEEAQAK